MAKVTAHCSHCGSTEIVVKGNLTWNAELGDWEISGVQNSAVCGKCHWRDHVEFRSGKVVITIQR